VIIAIVVVLLLIIIGGGVWWYMSSSSTSSTTTTPAVTTTTPTTTTNSNTTTPAASTSSTASNPAAATNTASSTTTAAAATVADEVFVIQSTNKGSICVDSNDGQTISGHTAWMYPCVTTNGNQRWVYDSKTREIMLANNKGYCLDDGGNTGGGDWPMKVAACNGGPTQTFAFNSNGTIYNTNKNQLCVDDNNAAKGGERYLHMWACDSTNNNQLFKKVKV